MATSWAIRVLFPRNGSFFLSLFCTICTLDRDSADGIVVRYGWTARGSNAGGGENFRTRPDRHWGPSTLLYNGYRVSFPGVKAAGAWCWLLTPSSAEVKEIVELYLLSPSGPSWPVLEWPLPFFFSVYTPAQGYAASPVRFGPVPGEFTRNIAAGHEADSTASQMPRGRMLSAVGPTSTPPYVFIAWCLTVWRLTTHIWVVPYR